MFETDSTEQPEKTPQIERLEKVRGIFQTFLKNKKLRQTPERFSILEEIYLHEGHFDADELFIALKSRNSRVSRATVYNSLDLLLESKLIVKHQFGQHQAKYERAFGFMQHDHLICTDCGKLFEFCDPRIQPIQEMVGEIYGFEIKHHSLQVYGECRRENCESKPEVGI